MKNFYQTLRGVAVAACLLLSSQNYALTIGSDYFTFTQAHVVFTSQFGADNSVSNFSWLKNGFTLQDASTTCTFTSIYPVSGLVDFNGGTLFLEQDLVMKDLVNWKSFGTIVGNGLNVDLRLATFAPVLSPTFPTFQDVNLLINGNFTLLRPFHFKGNCTVIGNNNLITLYDGIGAIVVDPGSTLTLQGVTVANVHGTNMRCADNAGSIIFDSTSIIQSGDYTFSTGSMSFENTVNWQGTFTFDYDSIQSSTIQLSSSLNILNGLTFSLGRQTDSTLIEPLVFVDQSSVLALNNATLLIAEYGAQFIKGTLQTSNIATIEVASTSTAMALEFGNGIPADDSVFYLNGGSTANFTTGLVIWNNTPFELLQGALNNAAVLQQDPSIFLFQRSYQASEFTFVPTTAAVFEFAPGAQLLANNLTVLTPNGGSYIVTGFFVLGVGFLLNGNQSMNIVSGGVPFAILVDGVGNRLSGAGNITFPVVLLDAGAELNWAVTGLLSTDMIMNGGTISQESSLRLGHDVLLSGTSTVFINNENVVLGDLNLNVIDPTYWSGSTGVMNMNSTINLSNTWTFSGHCILDGGGHPLNLMDGGSLVVEQGSTLELRNININNMSGTNVRCLDDASVLSLDSVACRLSGVYTFTIGSMLAGNFVTFVSNGDTDDIFAYQSDKPFLLAPNTSLTFENAATFSYDANSPDLLNFADKTSVLVLNDAILVAAQQGLHLEHGSLFVTGNSLLFTDSAITLGDCFTGTNDFSVTIASNAQLEIETGYFNYKNINASSWNMQATSILRTDGGAQLNLYQVLNLGTGSAIFGNNATIGNQSNLIGSSSQEGILNTVSLPPC